MAGGNASLEALVSPVGGEPSRPRCRSCGQADLRQVLDLGRVPLANALLAAEQLNEPEDHVLDLGCVPLANALLTTDQLNQAEDRFPLELYFCPQCALVQIGETVPRPSGCSATTPMPRRFPTPWSSTHARWSRR